MVEHKSSAQNRTPDQAQVEMWFAEESSENDEKVFGDFSNLGEKYSLAQLSVVRSNLDISLYMLRENAKSQWWLNLSPYYQRRHRWDDRKRSRLIESILMNIPIPPLFLYEEDYNSYEVMDGRQRLDTIISFLNDDFSLDDMEFWPEINGFSFSELPQLIQSGLLRRTLSAVVLLTETSRFVSEESDIRLVLFRRLNTGGAILNPQELRNALYPSPFNGMLKDAARSDVFTKVWGIPKKRPNEDDAPSGTLLKNPLYKTMADAELVLRFFAIRETIAEGRKGGLKSLLDQTMRRHQKTPPSRVDDLKKDFIYTISNLEEIFGEKTFRLPNGRLSRPLYDALMVGMSEVGAAARSPQAIRQSVDEALGTAELYEVLVGRGNTVDAIKQRVTLAKKLLTGHG